ncbi:MAG: glycosyltransferase family 9 protein, partial [Terracidiphilus sp.]
MQTQSKFRLLVVRLGAMGDILHALPAVTALRLAHPEWVIDWVVEPRWQALLAAEDAIGRVVSRPLVDHLLFAPTREWRDAPFNEKTHHEIKLLRRTLREGNYDAVLDLQGAIRSAVIGRFAKSVRLIGEEEPRERPARWLYTERVRTRGTHVIEQDVDLAAAVAGDDLRPETPLLPIDPAAEARADEVLSRSGSGNTVLINPGAGWGAKRWPVERYSAVAQGLIARGFRVVVNAGPREEHLAESIAAAIGGAAILLTGTIPQLIAITRRVA